MRDVALGALGGQNLNEKAQAAAFNAYQQQTNKIYGVADVQGSTTAPVSVLEAAENHAHMHTEALISVAVRLQAMRDRAFGSEPRVAESNSDTPQSEGLVMRLEAAIAPHDTWIARIHTLIRDLERLI